MALKAFLRIVLAMPAILLSQACDDQEAIQESEMSSFDIAQDTSEVSSLDMPLGEEPPDSSDSQSPDLDVHDVSLDPISDGEDILDTEELLDIPIECMNELTPCQGENETWTCVDLQENSCHCGRCGNNCLATGAECIEGSCGWFCGPGGTLCRKEENECLLYCTTIEWSRYDCGGCGIRCAPHELCNQAECVPVCDEGQKICGADCFDPLTDPTQCGQLEWYCLDYVECAEGQVCVMGECQ